MKSTVRSSNAAESIAPRGWKSRWNANRSKRLAKSQRKKERITRLSKPITTERIRTFLNHLVAVSFGAGEECWLYAGCGKATTLSGDISLPANGYAQVKFNGETVGPHQFALAASEGIPLIELAGFDVHHSSELGRCLGYRCCNPEHLEKRESRPHRGTRGAAGSRNPRHVRLVREVLGVHPAQRRPEEYRPVTGAGSKRRFFAGMPFLIRLGDLVKIEDEGLPA